LTNDRGFVALRRAVEDREEWRRRERMPKTCCTTTDDGNPNTELEECIDNEHQFKKAKRVRVYTVIFIFQ